MKWEKNKYRYLHRLFFQVSQVTCLCHPDVRNSCGSFLSNGLALDAVMNWDILNHLGSQLISRSQPAGGRITS